MNTTELTPFQQLIMRSVIQRAIAEDRPAAEVLLLTDAPDEDRAAVAEELSDGAGAGYLP